MRHGLYLFMLLFFAPSAFAQSLRPACPTYPNVPVKVTPVFDDPTYDNTTRLSALQILSGNDAAHIHESLTLGLTSYKPFFEIRVPVVRTQSNDGLACAYVDHVDVTFGYKDVTVYVAQEIPQNTCGFQEVAAHEQKHIAVNRQILQEFTPLIAEKIQAYMKTNGVFREQNPDYALSLVHEKLQAIMNETATAIVAENRRRQQDVDNPAEYARLGASCNGQLRSIAARFYTNR